MVAVEKLAMHNRLHFGRLKEAEQARRVWHADVPIGTVLNTVLESNYWAHYAKTIRPLDLIEVVCEDGSWEALLRVMFVGQTEIKTRIAFRPEYNAAEVEVPPSADYDIVWKGPVLKWAITNRANNEIVKDRFMPKSEAFNYLSQHINAMKA